MDQIVLHKTYFSNDTVDDEKGAAQTGMREAMNLQHLTLSHVKRAHSTVIKCQPSRCSSYTVWPYQCLICLICLNNK